MMTMKKNRGYPHLLLLMMYAEGDSVLNRTSQDGEIPGVSRLGRFFAVVQTWAARGYQLVHCFPKIPLIRQNPLVARECFLVRLAEI